MPAEMCPAQKCEPVVKNVLTADEISWIYNALDRYTEQIKRNVGVPAISRSIQTAKLAALLEIMETLNLIFEDKDAATNAISQFKELDIINPKTITITIGGHKK